MPLELTGYSHFRITYNEKVMAEVICGPERVALREDELSFDCNAPKSLFSHFASGTSASLAIGERDEKKKQEHRGPPGGRLLFSRLPAMQIEQTA